VRRASRPTEQLPSLLASGPGAPLAGKAGRPVTYRLGPMFGQTALCPTGTVLHTRSRKQRSQEDRFDRRLRREGGPWSGFLPEKTGGGKGYVSTERGSLSDSADGTRGGGQLRPSTTPRERRKAAKRQQRFVTTATLQAEQTGGGGGDLRGAPGADPGVDQLQETGAGYPQRDSGAGNLVPPHPRLRAARASTP